MSKTPRPTGEPTEEELAMADAYVRLRLNVEHTWTVGMKRLLDEALRDICRIVWIYTGGRVNAESFRFKNHPMIELNISSVLDRLRSNLVMLLTMDCETLSDDTVGELEVAQFDSDIEDILDGLKEETESRVAAYFYAGYDRAEMEQQMVLTQSTPWTDKAWLSAVMALQGRAAARILREGGVTSEVGRSKVSANKVRLYGEGQMNERYKELMRPRNAGWFLSIVQDGTACEACKEEADKGWQPIEDYQGLWHPYCRCRFVFRE